jgi:predicted esterase
MRPFVFAFALAGCVPEAEVTDWPEGLAPLTPLSSGECPDLTEPGSHVFVSDGVERRVNLYFPRFWDPGMPAIFFWHPLGATAAMVGNLIQAQTLAENHEIAVIMPQSLSEEPYEWAFYADDGGHDGVLYDDLRTCLVEQLQVDPERITSAGISAGGLWTSWMTMHRADTLATSLVMSGGTGQVVYYTPPAADIPVLVMWGGEPDTFELGTHTVDFNQQSIEFSQQLQEDGHFVVECNHGTGHTIPFDGFPVIPNWLLAHTWDEESPFASGDLGDLPDYCLIPGLTEP